MSQFNIFNLFSSFKKKEETEAEIEVNIENTEEQGMYFKYTIYVNLMDGGREPIYKKVFTNDKAEAEKSISNEILRWLNYSCVSLERPEKTTLFINTNQIKNIELDVINVETNKEG